jgi:hypothetical protein
VVWLFFFKIQKQNFQFKFQKWYFFISNFPCDINDFCSEFEVTKFIKRLLKLLIYPYKKITIYCIPPLSGMVHRKECWHKIRTLRQAHSKPTKLASHTSRFQSVLVNFPWKLTKDKIVKYQSLELAGWYQTVPYLRLESHVRWHIAMRSYLQ